MVLKQTLNSVEIDTDLICQSDVLCQSDIISNSSIICKELYINNLKLSESAEGKLLVSTFDKTQIPAEFASDPFVTLNNLPDLNFKDLKDRALIRDNNKNSADLFQGEETSGEFKQQPLATELLENQNEGVFVDKNNTGTEPESGSRAHPFKTLETAFTSVFAGTPGQANFVLGKGIYTVSNTLVLDYPSGWDVSIEGKGKRTVIQMADISKNLFEVKNVNSFSLSKVFLKTAKFLLKVESSVQECVVSECDFKFGGSLGIASLHSGLDQPWASTAFSAGIEMSDGGACLLENSDETVVKDCKFMKNYRSLKLSNCVEGVVDNCRVKNGLENGIVLNGCADVTVSNCKVNNVSGNALSQNDCLNCSFLKCSVRKSWGSPVKSVSPHGDTYSDCDFRKCNIKAFSGNGVSTSEIAQISVSGNKVRDVSLFDYSVKVVNCSFTKCDTVGSVFFDITSDQSTYGNSVQMFEENNIYEPKILTTNLGSWSKTEVGGLPNIVSDQVSKVDAILNLSNDDLNTLREIEDSFKASDTVLTQATTDLAASTLAARNAIVSTQTANKGLFDQEKIDSAAARTGIVSTQSTNKGLFDQEKIDSAAARTGIVSTQSTNKGLFDQEKIDSDAARTGIVGGASSSHNTLKKVEDLLDAEIASTTTRFSTLFDSGTALDTISELKNAWESQDTSLQNTLNNAIALKANLASPTFSGTVSGVSKVKFLPSIISVT